MRIRWRSAAEKGVVDWNGAEESNASPVLDAEQSEARRLVLAALAELPAEQREVLHLAYYGGLSQTEIAEKTRQPLGTVKTRMRLSMQKLQEQAGATARGNRDDGRARAHGPRRGLGNSLSAAALDALEPAELRAVMSHVAGCSLCTVELASLRESAAVLALASPAVAGADLSSATCQAMRGRLMARAKAEKVVPIGGAQRSSMALWFKVERIAAAASILLVVSVATLAAVMRDRETLRDAVREADASAAHAKVATDSLRTMVVERDKMLAGLTGKDMAMVTLTSSGAQAAWALMFWDRATNAWTFVKGHSLPKPKAGRTYQLWLVTASAKISAGTFEPGGDGEAMMRAVYAMPQKCAQGRGGDG